MIGFWDANKLFWRNYVNFQGRATKAEFWWPWLLNTAVVVGLSSVAFSLMDFPDMETAGAPDDVVAGFVVIAVGVFLLAAFLPSVSLHVRRLHDFNASGWIYAPILLVTLIFSFLGLIASVVVGCIPGTPGPNQYGGGDDADYLRDTFS